MRRIVALKDTACRVTVLLQVSYVYEPFYFSDVLFYFVSVSVFCVDSYPRRLHINGVIIHSL